MRFNGLSAERAKQKRRHDVAFDTWCTASNTLLILLSPDRKPHGASILRETNMLMSFSVGPEGLEPPTKAL